MNRECDEGWKRSREERKKHKCRGDKKVKSRTGNEGDESDKQKQMPQNYTNLVLEKKDIHEISIVSLQYCRNTKNHEKKDNEQTWINAWTCKQKRT